MKKGTNDTILGLVFFAGMALLLWATQQLSGLGFQQTQNLTVEFPNARGLRVGEPVFLLGKQVGKVASAEIVQRDQAIAIRTQLQIDTSVPIRQDTLIEVVDASMLGGKRVDITPGSGAEVAKEHTFTGIASLGPLDSLGNLIGGDENKDNLSGAIKAIRTFFESLNDGKGSVARLINDDTLIRDAEAMVKSLRTSVEALEARKSLLSRLIYDEELGAKTDSIVTNIETATKKLNSTDNTLGKLLNDPEMANQLDKIVDDVEKVTTSLNGTEGTLGKLLNDKVLASKLDGIVDDIQKVSSNLNKPDSGLLGALLNDGALLADGRKFMRDLSEISDKINTGQGALGRLINDEDLGRRLDSVIRQVTRAVEDAREAAPIGTFFQVFSGAF